MIGHHNVVVFKLFYFKFRQFYCAQKMQPKERAMMLFLGYLQPWLPMDPLTHSLLCTLWELWVDCFNFHMALSSN